ncbi:hypothetical protein GCM10009530_48400 [Microbispora corallina]|uniref:Uncharacterized protein n=1 Tax=Microbispora corallina TaxID=83302 RepID=A0ABQ4G5R3_9ACTN|nr:hypothetical protein [Microbispora corallina]GIH42416.1 hypothetical protein Mco01_54160 [Microbispora corallina]
MREAWVHVGRLWTNGDPFLAVDASLRGAWRGFSDDQYDDIVEIGQEVTSIAVGSGRAVLVGADGVVRDDSWMEVFQAEDGGIAVVQASGPDYPRVVNEALHYPDTDDEVGDPLIVSSGELALFSAACDGAGPYAASLVPARPGPGPLEYGRPSNEDDPGLLITTTYTTFGFKVRWYTLLDEENCFARWLLTPVRTF